MSGCRGKDQPDSVQGQYQRVLCYFGTIVPPYLCKPQWSIGASELVDVWTCGLVDFGPKGTKDSAAPALPIGNPKDRL